MRPSIFITLIAVSLVGCDRRDPIERLMAKLEKEAKTIRFTSYPFRPVDLSTNARPEEVISELVRRGDLSGNIVVIKTREVQTPEDMLPHRHHTALLLASSVGERIVLVRPMHKGWYYRIYDSE